MPQLDITHYPAQLFWLFVSFGFLFCAIMWVILPRIQRNIQARENRIQSSLNSAEQVRTSREELVAKYENLLEEGKRKVRLMLEENAARINARWDKKNKILVDEIQVLIQEEKARIKREEKKLVDASKQAGREIAQRLEARFRG